MAAVSDADRIAALRLSLEHVVAERDTLRTALQAAQAFGSQGDTPEGFSVSEMIRTALAIAAPAPPPATLADLAAAHAALDRIEKRADAALRQLEKVESRGASLATDMRAFLEEIAEECRTARS